MKNLSQFCHFTHASLKGLLLCYMCHFWCGQHHDNGCAALVHLPGAMTVSEGMPAFQEEGPALGVLIEDSRGHWAEVDRTHSFLHPLCSPCQQHSDKLISLFLHTLLKTTAANCDHAHVASHFGS